MGLQNGEIRFSVEDGKGRRSSDVVFYWSSDTVLSLPDIELFAHALWFVLSPLTVGGNPRFTLRMDLGYTLIEPDKSPGANSDNEEGVKAVFSCADSSGVYVTRLTIPCVNEDKILPNQTEWNAADADVAAFITFMVSPFGGGEDMTDRRGADITGYIDGFEVFGG